MRIFNIINQLQSNLSLSWKVSIVSFVSITIIFTIFSFVLFNSIKNYFFESDIKNLKDQTNFIKHHIEQFDFVTKENVATASRIFSGLFKDDFSIDNSKQFTYGDLQVSALKNGSDILNSNNSYVDKFTQITGSSVATIFVRHGDDFVRIATSLKKEDGSRAVGTKLDRNHPGYGAVLKGEIYFGKARLFGKDYMTKYTPIKDKNNQVIGILFVGTNISEPLSKLFAYLKSIKVGDTGYIYILDAREGKDKGTFVLHPTLEGKNGIDAKDASGRLFIKEIIDKKEGVIEYPWKNPNETSPRNKIAVYTYIKEWQWVVASGSYSEEVLKNAIIMRNYLIIGTILSAIIIGIVISLLMKYLLKGIQKLCNDIDLIIKGDLTVKFEAKNNDEIGHISKQLNKLTETFNDLISGLIQGSMNVITSVDILRLKSYKTSQGAKSQSEQSSAIAAAAEEMNQTIGDIAKNASISSETSERAVLSAAKGKEIVNDSIATVNNVDTTTNTLAQLLARLNNRVEEIGSIVTVIKDIADQTNLLALNAAIEAARAGEQGRGFAVVADEVRKLAEKTIKATVEISEKIQAVQNESAETVSTMDQTSREVRNANQKISQAGLVLDEIASSMEQAKDQIIQIATAIEEQSSASHEIASNVQKNSDISLDIQQMSEEVLREVSNLIDVANYLRNSSTLFITYSDKYTIFDLTKADHKAFVAQVFNAIHNNIAMDPDKLPDHRNCRLGKWYASKGAQACGHISTFREIDVPHEKIHSLAKEAIRVAQSGDKVKAEKLFQEVEELSMTISKLLDKLKDECKSNLK